MPRRRRWSSQRTFFVIGIANRASRVIEPKRLTRRQFKRFIDGLHSGTEVIMEACGAAHSSVYRWNRMRKAFQKRPAEEAARAQADAQVAVVNYITPGGLRRLKDEHRFLLTRERPAVTKVVAWAASNGDRSENADYQYNKRRLRQIDRRIRFLTNRIDAAEVVDPEAPRAGPAASHVFFGATVRYTNAVGTERAVSVVGLDEVDLNRNHISWLSPLARALMKAGPGDRVVLHAPGGTEQLRILEVRYERIPVEPFREPPGAEAAPKAPSRIGR